MTMTSNSTTIATTGTMTATTGTTTATSKKKLTSTACVSTAPATAKNVWGNGCAAYSSQPFACPLGDDEDFTAAEMCCECEGVPIPACVSTAPASAKNVWGNGCSAYSSQPFACPLGDDEDFTATEMCCECKSK